MSGPVLAEARADGRVIVHCQLNVYRTPLFSFDERGLWVRCKDCRVVDRDTGDTRRGAYHLYPWADVLRMMVGLWEEPEHAALATELREEPEAK